MSASNNDIPASAPSANNAQGAGEPHKHEPAEVLEREVWVPKPLGDVFTFFADAGNLEQLTPPWLSFQILTAAPIEMQVGTLIDYQIKLYGVPMSWQTRISDWQPPHRFVDEQLRGPYLLWWHEHTFLEKDGATRIADRVHYRAPLHFLSAPLMVRGQLKRIFDFRRKKIIERFGGPVQR